MSMRCTRKQSPNLRADKKPTERIASMNKSQVIIVGAGAGGLFSAIMLARNGVKCLVIEQNKILGKKLLITGKGRCNVTNNCDAQTVMNNIPHNSRFMYSALSSFEPKDTIRFFEELGVELKTERGNRVFPKSDRSQSIVNALIDEAKRLGVRFVKEKVLSLSQNEGSICEVVTDKSRYLCDNVIVATGGKSYPNTGSTGDGYAFAEGMGHTVTELCPSLVPIVTEESEPTEMMGLSLKNVTLTLKDNKKNKKIYSEMGEMLFTHFGISGPLVLSASAHIDRIEKNRYTVEIDLKPALSEKQLDERILRDFSQELNRDFCNSLGMLLPSAIIPIIVSRSKIPPNQKVNSITKQQRQALVNAIKCYTLTVRDFRPIDEAIITRGGVSIKEISPKTMESKLVNGLYFVGEIIDVDAYTGGFNLQIAFSTAYCAAQAITEKLAY